MKSNRGGAPLWGYRYRTGGRGSGRMQRGGFGSEQDARESLERALERVRRANGTGTTLTLARLVDESLAPARRAAGDDREAALALVESGQRGRRSTVGTAAFAGDRSLADDE